jgi:hypothetical protein
MTGLRAARPVLARYTWGSCPACGKAILKDQPIRHQRDLDAWFHDQCLGSDEDEWGSGHD